MIMKIDSMISAMTLEEKASLCSGADFWHTMALSRIGVEAVMLTDGPNGLRKQDFAKDGSGVNDSIKAICFPTASALAAGFDPALCKMVGEALGDACQHEGVGIILGPAVNIKRSPLCGRNHEYFSEDPYLTGVLAAGMIQGIQSRGVGACVKHFAANNQEHRRMASSSEVDERTMREIYLPAFEAAVKAANVWTVMCSYNRINGVYASQNFDLLTGILRNEWGFDGYVVSDWGAVSDRVSGLAAGLDLEMPSSNGVNDARIVQAVRGGILDEKVLNQAVKRILSVYEKHRINRKLETDWDKEEQHELARRIAAECMVLLKNEDRTLPLRKDDSIAVIGSFAAVPRYQGGGSSHVNSHRVTSLMDALRDNRNVVFAEGFLPEQDETDEALVKKAVQAAASAHVAVVVAGLPDSFESEGYDRKHMRMPVCQNELIERVAKANPNTVVIMYNGSPVEMPWIDKVKAVLEAYLGGQAVGAATKDVLFGDVNPCGRLPESFPLKLEDSPSYLSYGGEGNKAIYAEGIFVGYRYYDKKKTKMLFPFGHGLSYTDFAYDNLIVSADAIWDYDNVCISVDVTNLGDRAGKEVVQLYISDLESTVFRPVRELKGIGKIYLQPGERQTVSFELGKRAFAYWNVDLHDWYVESGLFAVQIGRNCQEIVLEKTIVVKGSDTIPQTITMDTLVMDLKDNENIQPMLDTLTELMMGVFGENHEKLSDISNSAVSPAMRKAMLENMPLRAALSFGEVLSYEQLQSIIDQMNHMN